MSAGRERPPGLGSPGVDAYSAHYAKRTNYPLLPGRGPERVAALETLHRVVVADATTTAVLAAGGWTVDAFTRDGRWHHDRLDAAALGWEAAR